MKELVEFIAQAVVNHPDQVHVDEYPQDDGSIIYELSVANEDKGRMIGKNGRVIQSVRSVVLAAARKKNLRVKLNLRE